MNLAITSIVGFAMFGALAIAQAQQPPASEVPAGVRNYTRVDATFACAGATPLESLPEIKRAGFRAIVNLRREQEAGADVPKAREAAAGLGLKYIHIPVDSNAPTRENADQFLKAVSDPENQPLFIHCASANRVGAMWLIKRVRLDGWPTDKALAEAETIGLGSPVLKQFALDYVRPSGR